MSKIHHQYLKNTPHTATEGLFDHDAPVLPEGMGFIVQNITINIVQWQLQGFGFSVYPVVVDTIKLPSENWQKGILMADEKVSELNLQMNKVS